MTGPRGVGERKKPLLKLAEGEPSVLTVVAAGVLGIQPVRVEKDPTRTA